MVAQTQSQMGESSSSTPLSMDDIYTQVMGLERHGFGFGATPTLVFGATTKQPLINIEVVSHVTRPELWSNVED